MKVSCFFFKWRSVVSFPSEGQLFLFQVKICFFFFKWRSTFALLSEDQLFLYQVKVSCFFSKWRSAFAYCSTLKPFLKIGCFYIKQVLIIKYLKQRWKHIYHWIFNFKNTIFTKFINLIRPIVWYTIYMLFTAGKVFKTRKVHKSGEVRQKTWNSRHETRDKRQETGDKRQEKRDMRQETRDVRQDTWDRRQET